jgi:hypothetical protein
VILYQSGNKLKNEIIVHQLKPKKKGKVHFFVRSFYFIAKIQVKLKYKKANTHH